jgi:hypothetical protein
MLRQSSAFRRFCSAIALTGCVATGFSASALAQSNSGFTIFSGVESQYQLGYRLDEGGRLGVTDRYRLNIGRKHMTLAANQFTVTYPETYRGEFDADRVDLYVNGKKVAVDEVDYDPDNRSINIFPVEVVPANSRVQIRLSGVQNPTRIGTHYFNAQIHAPGDLPMARYVGTWILSIGGN